MMFWDLIINDFNIVLYAVDILLIMMMIFWEHSNTKTTIMWVVIMAFLPLIGFLAYLTIGQTFYTKWSFKSKNVTNARLQNILAIETEGVESELKYHPESQDRIAFAKSLTRAGSWIYSGWNKVDLFTEGNSKFSSLFDDLRNAKEHINVEYYILRNDDLGNELMDILIAKAREGVEVRLMVDAIGFNKGSQSKIKALRAAGGKFSLFHGTLAVVLSPRKNNRNHRKLAVIDGRIAYVGGFNIGDEYLGKGPMGYWRDSGIRLEGVAVFTVQAQILADWYYACMEDVVTEQRFYNNVTPSDVSDGVQIVSGGPDCSRDNPIHTQYTSMIWSAEKTLYMHTPYLSPNDALIGALKTAAYRGVDVRLIIPDKPDHPFVYWNNIYYADRLMGSGVRVYMYNRGFVHSKTMVVDSRYSSVGSANFDERSMTLNFETNAMIYSERVGRLMTDAFLEDLEYCTEYTREMYASNPTITRLKIGISRLFDGQL